MAACDNYMQCVSEGFKIFTIEICLTLFKYHTHVHTSNNHLAYTINMSSYIDRVLLCSPGCFRQMSEHPITAPGMLRLQHKLVTL